MEDLSEFELTRPLNKIKLNETYVMHSAHTHRPSFTLQWAFVNWIENKTKNNI